MKKYVLKILFSSVKYSYESDYTREAIMEKISEKIGKKKKLFSAIHYSGIVENETLKFSIVKKGYWMPISVAGSVVVNTDLSLVQLDFKSFISPLFIFGPICLFLYPVIFPGGLMVNSSMPIFPDKVLASVVYFGLFAVLTILFVHVPIQKEKKDLERTLKLKPI